MDRSSKVIVLVAAAVPLLFLGQCMYREVSMRNALEDLCKGATQGTQLTAFLHSASEKSIKVRTGGPSGKNADEWFDRQYLRLGEYLKQVKKLPDDYTVAFAKPGVGYYACIVTHEGGTVKAAWFEDHSN